MGIKYNPSEPYEEWVKRVGLEETGLALRRLAKGDNVNLVMEAMSARIIEKCLFPLYQEINKIK